MCNSVDDYLSGVSLFKHLCKIIKHLISCCSESQSLARIHTNTRRGGERVRDFLVKLLSESICKMTCLLFQQNRNQLALWPAAAACSIWLESTENQVQLLIHIDLFECVYLSLVVMHIIAIRFDFERFSIFSKTPLHTNI